jgi:putative oxidoreductase
MKYVYIVARVLLALAFIPSGIDKLHQIFPHPPMVPGDPQTIMFTLLATTGWLKVIGLTELLGGIFVLVGRTVPLSICLLAPVTINILAFGYLVAGGGKNGLGGLITAALELLLIYGYRHYFAGILSFEPKTTA